MSPESSDPAPRQFVTLAAVAGLLSLSLADVESIVTSGELPAIRVGPADEWRVELSVLDGYLDAKYEETRRSALFSGFDYGDIVDIDSKERRIANPRENPDAG